MQEKKKYQSPFLFMTKHVLHDVLFASRPAIDSYGDDFGTGETEWGEWN